jgi:hypothetical protein
MTPEEIKAHHFGEMTESGCLITILKTRSSGEILVSMNVTTHALGYIVNLKKDLTSIFVKIFYSFRMSLKHPRESCHKIHPDHKWVASSFFKDDSIFSCC